MTKDEVISISDACNNIRDRFLLQLLFESGMRIGEALALWLEDFEIDACRVHIKDREELDNLAEIKTVSSPRCIDVSIELIDLYCEYVSEYHTDVVDTNHVFIKLSGSSTHLPMEYHDVISLILRLRKKTGIFFTAHMLHHTSLTMLSRSGWPVDHLRLRAGHKNVQSTFIYIHPSDEDLRKDWEMAERCLAYG